MTLEALITDIKHYGGVRLAELGLTVEAIHSDDPESYDDEIIFRTSDGARLAVQLQASSLEPIVWDETSIAIYVFEDKALGATGYSSRGIEGARHIPLQDNVKSNVKRLISEIEKSELATVPVDSIKKMVANDPRMPEIVKSLEYVQEALTGISTIYFGMTSDVVDWVTLASDDVDFVTVNLHEADATIRNCINGAEEKASGIEKIKTAIHAVAFSSYSADPSI